MILLKGVISLINVSLAIMFLLAFGSGEDDELLDGVLGWGALLLIANTFLIWG